MRKYLYSLALTLALSTTVARGQLLLKPFVPTITAGTFSDSFNYTNTSNTSDFGLILVKPTSLTLPPLSGGGYGDPIRPIDPGTGGGGYGSSMRHLQYRFTITRDMSISLSGSGVPSPDGESAAEIDSVSLLDSSDKKLFTTIVPPASNGFSLYRQLPAGTYTVLYKTLEDGMLRMDIKGTVPTDGGGWGTTPIVGDEPFPWDDPVIRVLTPSIHGDFTYTNVAHTDNLPTGILIPTRPITPLSASMTYPDTVHEPDPGFMEPLYRPRTFCYKLTLRGKTLVVVSNDKLATADDTGGDYPAEVVSVGLLDSAGVEIAAGTHIDNMRGETGTLFRQTLQAGTYYIRYNTVVDGYVRTNIIGYTGAEFNYPDIPDGYSGDPAGVGGVPMSLGVSAMGGAALSVPIDVPRGVVVLQPRLGLEYDSQGGNGVAGFGCDISGLSAITRAPRDIYHDGVAGALTYGTGDAYYLDGQRLMPASGIDGADGAVYNPESDPFTSITLHGNGAGAWLEAHAPNGMTYYYGSGTGRQVMAVNGAQRVISWRLDHVVDPLGNYMDYAYIPVDNTVYLSGVTYGGNTGVGTGLTNTVSFTYETRQDVTPFIIGGTKGQVSQRLKSITTKTNNNVYRTYTLNYNTTSDGIQTPFSRLTSISVANSKGEQLKPITLNWQYIPSVGETRQAASGLSLPSTGTMVDGVGPYMLSGDVNGDGLSDILTASPMEASDGEVEDYTKMDLYLASSNGTGNTQFNHQTTVSVPKYSTGKFFGSPCVDYDGDGINEFVTCKALTMGTGSLKGWVTLGFIGGALSGAVTIPLINKNLEMPCLALGDLNNDGRGEVIILEKGNNGNMYHLSISTYDTPVLGCDLALPSKPMQTLPSDFNGDGLVDIMALYGGGYTIFWNHGGGLSDLTFGDNKKATGTNFGYALSVTPGDFNGDGLADFVMVDKEGDPNCYMALSNGDGTFTKSVACTLPIYDQDFTDKDNYRVGLNVLDFDGDGKSDLVVTKPMYARDSDLFGEWGNFDKAYTVWLRSTGTSFTAIKTATSVSDGDGKPGYYTTGDLDGDGRVELMNYGYDCFNGNNANVSPTWNIYSNNNFTDNTGKVTSIVDSYGSKTEITYSPLTRNNIYAKGTDATYPMVDLAAPINVVKSVTAGNGAAGDITTNYSYYGLKAHLQGKGLLGFSSMTADNATLGAVTTSGVRAWDNCVPSATFTDQTVSGRTARSLVSMHITRKGNGSYFAYPSSRVDTDLDGNQSTTTTAYDTNNGYPIEERVMSAPGMYKARQYSNHALTAGGWKPGLITEVSKHPDDGAESVRRTAYTYDSATGLKTVEVGGSGDPLALTTTYAYDRVGNAVSSTQSGAGVTPVTTYTAYDQTYRLVTKAYTSPATTTMAYAYDTFGNVLAKTDITNQSDALTTTYEYDGWGNLTGTTYPDGTREVTKMGWTSDTGKRYFTLTEGTAQPWVKTWYDAKGREVGTETIGRNSLPISTQTSHDFHGNVISNRSVSGNLTITDSYAYDGRDRPITYNSSTGKGVSYTYGNRTVATTDAGRTTTKAVDAWGNTVSSKDPASSVTYAYSSNGKPKSVTSAGAAITMEYDALGNQTKLIDPDAGTYTYAYDAAGRVTTQTDGDGHVTTNTYDGSNRLASKTVAGVTTTYTYGTAGNEINQLVMKSIGEDWFAYTHDRYGRVTSERRMMRGYDFTTTYTYNAQGQPASTTYHGGVTVANSYDAYGNLSSVYANGQPVWQSTGADGTTYTSLLGGKLVHSNGYNTQTGMLSYVNYGRAWDDLIHESNYDFDGATGNLMSRSFTGSPTEYLTYDDMDRLTSVNGVSTMEMTYGEDGNMASKTGVGAYHYDLVQPHAVSTVKNASQVINTGNQTIAYNGFNKVQSINEASGGTLNTLLLTYGHDQQRWKTQLLKNGTLSRQTIFAGDYEAETEGRVTRQLYYIYGGEGLAAIYVKETGKPDNIYYSITDHLGSFLQLVDINGNEVFAATYDAWGKRTVTNSTFPFRRGYGGHEHLDEFNLINMNGRLYDQFTGRFLSPDPYVQMPGNSQNLNRYSYCLNNPLKYTDPTGQWFGIDDLIVAGVGAFINVTVNAFQGNIHSLGQALSYIVVGAIGAEAGYYATTLAGPLVGGTVAGAVIGGGNSFVTQGFGSDGHWNWSNVSGMKVLFDGIVGGITGLASSALSGVISPYVSSLTSNLGGQAIQQAVTGAVTGAAVGFTMGTGMALLNGESIGAALASGGIGALYGFGIGATSGLVSGMRSAYKANENPWTGKANYVEPNNVEQTPITGFSNHAQQRILERNVSIEDINNALNKPLKITDVRYDENGPSIKYVGSKVTVVVNPETGNVITVIPTGTQRLNSILNKTNK